jgi:hypothetical protein
MTTRKYDAGKKTDSRRLKKLCRAAFLLVDANADNIAIALMNGTSHGETLSKRLLFEMAETGVDTEQLGLGPVVSLADRLKAEPQVPPLADDEEQRA